MLALLKSPGLKDKYKQSKDLQVYNLEVFFGS